MVTIDGIVKKIILWYISSFPKRRESIHFNLFRIPTFSGMTEQGVFYESITIKASTKHWNRGFSPCI